MAVARPTLDQMSAIADSLGMDLSPERVEEFLGHMAGSFAAYDLVEAMPDEVPEVFAKERVDVVFHGTLATSVRVDSGVAPLEDPETTQREVARILAPVSAPSLRGALALMARHNPGLGPLMPVVSAALKTGELEQGEVEGKTIFVYQVKAGKRDILGTTEELVK